MKISDRINRLLSRGPAARFPIVYVCEYPKSGGTWLASMLGDVMNLPRPEKSIFPVGHPAVVHNHWPYNPKRRHVVYLYRDGRDILVSSYFHVYRRIQNGDDLPRHLPSAYRHLFEKPAPDPRADLAEFVKAIFSEPLGNRLNWAQHIVSWSPPDGHEGVVYVSYEALLADARAEVNRIVTALRGEPPEGWRVEIACEKFSMARQTGRSAGQEDSKHFIRKGVAGDWKNYFNRAAAAAFDELAGTALVRLGYEPDRGWIDRVPERLTEAD